MLGTFESRSGLCQRPLAFRGRCWYFVGMDHGAPINSLPKLGSHIASHRRGYWHHGIYCGDGIVVHFSGLSHWPNWRKWRYLPRILALSSVEEISLRRFCAGHGYKEIAHPAARYGSREVVERARKRLGERGYSALSNNCEHFVNWCIEGQPRSWVIWRMLMLVGTVAGALAMLALWSFGKRPHAALTRWAETGIPGLLGALGMAELTRMTLRPVLGVNPEELRRRTQADQAAWLGALLGFLIGSRSTRSRHGYLAAPWGFLLPPLLALLAYLCCPARSVKKLK